MMNSIVNILLITGLLISLTINSYTLFAVDNREPVKITNTRVENVDGKLNPKTEILIISANVIRTRDCATTTHRFILDENKTVVFRETVPFAGNKVGLNRVRSYIKIPEDLKPGHYTYEPVSYSDCANKIYMHRAPPFPFEVVAG